MTTPTKATATTQRSTRFPLDGLRAVAAASVIYYHAYQNNTALPGDFELTGLAKSLTDATSLSVDLFFILSGFLLWLPVARRVIEGRRPGTGMALLRRRALRLVPLYYVVFILAWALANPGTGNNWEDLLLHLTFTQVYSDTYIFWTVGPAWSLAVEFHFYILMALSLPVMAIAAQRLPGRGARLLAVLALPLFLIAFCVLYFLTVIVWIPQDTTAWSVWFSPLAQTGDFGLGMLTAVLVASGVTWGRATRRAALALAALGFAAMVLVGSQVEGVAAEGVKPLFALVATMVLSVIVFNRDAQPRWLTWSPLVYLGSISYSTYLVHELVMHSLRNLGLLPSEPSFSAVLLVAVVVFAGSVLMGTVTYRLVERPSMRLLALWDADGKPVDHYRHVTDTPPVRQPAHRRESALVRV